MGKIQIHDYERQYEYYLRRLEQLDISKKNLKTIFRFRDVCFLNGMSKPRVIHYFRFFVFLFGFFDKDLETATKEDIEGIVAEINTKESFSPTTKYDCKVMLKRFYKLLKGNDEEYPEEVKWIKNRIKQTEKKIINDGELITPEDVDKMIEVAEYSRDKAFISLLYESGCRIGEVGCMAIGNVNFDKYGTVINVTGKTGSRKIRVVSSTPHLKTWLNVHPFKNRKDKPLWINFGARNHNKAMVYAGLRKVLISLSKKAGIDKRCNPHIFRHSRATYMANHLTEFQMNQYFGWIQGSDMPSTYVHLSGKEIDKAVLQMNGMHKKREEKEEAKVRVCPRCDSINDNNDIYCSKCSFILDEKEAVKIETEKMEDEQMTELSKKVLERLSQISPQAMDIITEEMGKLK